MTDKKSIPLNEMTKEERQEAFETWVKAGEEKKLAKRALLEPLLQVPEAREALVQFVTKVFLDFIPAICMDEAKDALSEAFSDYVKDETK